MNNYKTMAVALATFITMGITNSAYAADPIDGKPELVFMGSNNKLPVFQLTLNNSTTTEYLITVMDNDNTVLLRETLKGSNVSRRYKLDVEELSYANGTTIKVTNKLTKETTVFVINSTSYAVEDVSVAKL